MSPKGRPEGELVPRGGTARSATRALASVARAMGLAMLPWAFIASAQAADLGPVGAAEEREWPRVYVAEGVIEAVRQTTLAAQIAGRVTEFRVRAGDAVRAGQVLARIDPRTAEQGIAAAQSQIADAEATLANARRRHERNRELAARGFVSRAALDQTEAELKSAEAQAAVARANAAQARTAETFTVLTAPYSGIVGSTDAEVGDMATPGRPILSLFDPGALRVTATVPQGVLSSLRLGERVDVELTALARTVKAGKATIVPLADARTHTARVRLDLPLTPGLLPGQFARARFVTGTLRALAVPVSAILRRGELTAVYVIDERGVPKLRQVRTGETLGDAAGTAHVEILSGLAGGERVALEPVRAGMAASPTGR